jgi:hypothetical protein
VLAGRSDEGHGRCRWWRLDRRAGLSNRVGPGKRARVTARLAPARPTVRDADAVTAARQGAARGSGATTQSPTWPESVALAPAARARTGTPSR